MKYRLFLSVAAALAAAGASAAPDTIGVTRAMVSGPYSVPAPYMSSVRDAGGREFSASMLLDFPNEGSDAGSVTDLSTLKFAPGEVQTATVRFRLTATGLARISVPVDGVAASKVRLDGKELNGETPVTTGDHDVEVYFVTDTSAASPKIHVVSDCPAKLTVNEGNGKRALNIRDILEGRRFISATLSPDGTMLLKKESNTIQGGKVTYTASVLSAADGKTIASVPESVEWMPNSDLLYGARIIAGDNQLYTLDPRTGVEKIISHRLPVGDAIMAPDENFVAITVVTEGPKEGDVYQILEPEDRQPGWRDRMSVVVRDLRTGQTRPVTFGAVSTRLADISPDGKKLLVISQRSRLERRPTQVFNVMVVDVATCACDTLVNADGFVDGARFSPDGQRILITGSPEALGGVGKNVPQGVTPSMSDRQAYIMDIASRNITPITRDFNPSVNKTVWSRADNRIYMSATDGDCIRLYSYEPVTKKFSVAATGEDIVSDFSLPSRGNRLAWIGQGASNSDRLYVTDLRKKSTLRLDDAKGEQLADVRLGRCEAWNFVNSRGDTIVGRYYLPADFDPDKKYPLIVNYYGGCSPTERNFESRYPHHLYAAQGYVVYVLNPSGCTGRGQEFSSRHVNTSGKGVAEDIIEGTEKFCSDHPYIDASRIGCIGASYGGFMTQYLQTVTDIFAAAVSHAGISDNTSYWGEGYWGYSYSEVSMADSYPWSHRELYVDRSPLYNADKIHTPLLFLHGDADHNVPVGESIQMFTALKLLGRPTAFVAVSGQDHHILDYDKRLKWTDTIFAWFDKYLRDDPDAWEALYPDKDL